MDECARWVEDREGASRRRQFHLWVLSLFPVAPVRNVTNHGEFASSTGASLPIYRGRIYFHRKRKYEARQRECSARRFLPLRFPPPATRPLFAIVSSFLLFVYKPRHVIISRRYPLIKLLSLIFLVPTWFSGGSLSTPRCISLPLCPLQRLLLSLNLD